MAELQGLLDGSLVDSGAEAHGLAEFHDRAGRTVEPVLTLEALFDRESWRDHTEELIREIGIERALLVLKLAGASVGDSSLYRWLQKEIHHAGPTLCATG